MGTFDAPDWEVDKASKILSDKFGKVNISKGKKNKGRNQGSKTSVPTKLSFGVDLNRKTNKRRLLKTGDKFTKVGARDNAVKVPTNQFKLPKEARKKKKNSPSKGRVCFPRSEMNSCLNGKKFDAKRNKNKKEDNLPNTTLKRSRGIRKKHQTKSLQQNVQRSYVSNPNAVNYHDIDLKNSKKNTVNNVKWMLNSSKKLKHEKKSRDVINKKVKKRKAKKNFNEIEVNESKKNDVKFQGSFDKVLASNAYSSHSVKHKTKKNKKMKLNSEEHSNHAPGENKRKPLKSFSSRLLNYTFHKNKMSQNNAYRANNSKKRKCENIETEYVQPRKKLKLKCDEIKNKFYSVSKQTKVEREPTCPKNLKSRHLSGTLRERMLSQLKSSRFRYINEQLYTSSGKDALDIFKADPKAFHAYHEGYEQQVAQWPLNPVNKIINALQRKSSNLVVADFGCGDAKIAKSLSNKVYSFDLVALCSEVTVCDMAHTPLGDGVIDICVFCLSLMGTNLMAYLLEANRVLKTGGLLKIAEVASRFENVDEFIKSLKKYGFRIQNKDFSHDLFFFMDFKKENSVKKTKGVPPLSLKPCFYKKR